MLMILMSFPISYLIYTGIFQITMNTTLNQLTIFIVLGIAADDIFVFCDAWRQAEAFPKIASDEHRRLAYAFKRSFRAILVTSSTTAVAFLANALSDIRPIRAFGIFAAILIPVNFMIVILVVPSLQLIHDRRLKDKRILFCCRKKETEVKPKVDCMTNYFTTKHNSIIYKLRYIIAVFFILLGIGAAIIASRIGPLTKPEEYIPQDDPYMTLQTEVEQNFL